jgi:glycosyltransferase involved in cell wall biosynthesis
VVIHQETGFLFPVGEIQTMADAAIDLLKDEEKLRRFRKNARRRAVERFDASKIIPQYEKIYRANIET